MGVITSSNNTIFKDSAIVISNVKRYLKSFNAFNLLSEEEFYRYISDIIHQLGIGIMQESDALVFIESSKGVLPYNFKTLYAAYKTTPFFQHSDIERLQSNSFSITTDITHEIISQANKCTIECCENSQKVIEKLTIRNFVNEGKNLNFSTPILLRLSPNVKRDFIEQNCHNLNSGSKFEITIDGNFLYTNFDKDVVYIKYYGFPVDKDTGLPMIPNIRSAEKAIEWYIIWQTLMGLWYNSDAPDMQNKWQAAKVEYEHWFAQAEYEVKLPSFQTLLDQIRRNRGNLSIYQMTDNNRSY